MCYTSHCLLNILQQHPLVVKDRPCSNSNEIESLFSNINLSDKYRVTSVMTPEQVAVTPHHLIPPPPHPTDTLGTTQNTLAEKLVLPPFLLTPGSSCHPSTPLNVVKPASGPRHISKIQQRNFGNQCYRLVALPFPVSQSFPKL